MTKTFLKINFFDIEFAEKSGFEKLNIVCAVLQDKSLIGKFGLQTEDDQACLFPISTELIQLQFETKDTKQLIGNIEFTCEMLKSLQERNLTQWFTLVSSTGNQNNEEIGEHLPRALLSFKLEQCGQNFEKKSPQSQHEQQNLQAREKKNNQQAYITDNGKYLTGSTPIGLDDETTVVNLDGKMTDLMSMLQNQGNKDVSSKGLSNKKTDIILYSDKPEEIRDLLELEIKKSKMLEDSLRQTEKQLRKQEKLYSDLELKLQAQFKQSLGKNKTLNDETYNLKQKVVTLELELSKLKEECAEQVKKMSQSHNKESDYDKSVIEKYVITIQNLEKLNEDLNIQLENAKNVCNQEKETNRQLQKQMEENLANNRESLSSLKDTTRSYFEQIQTIMEEKTKLEVKNSNNELKLQTLELKHQSLQTEYESCKKDLEKFIKEVQDYKDLNSSLKRSLEELSIQKDKELLVARENILNLEERIKKAKIENEFLAAEKRETNQELINIRQMNYESRVENLESALKQSEEARKSLQGQLHQSEARIQGFIQQQKEKSIFSKVIKIYEDTIQELREKVKALTTQVEDLTCQLDQAKYEIVDLKIKLDEYQETDEQLSRLKGKLNSFKEENFKLKDSAATIRKQLFNTSTELIRQTNIALEEGLAIQDLDSQMQTLDNSLRIAFGDIKKMHFTLEAAKRIGTSYEPYIPVVNDEIEQKVSDFTNKARLPIRFLRLKEGVYSFGSKNIQMKILNDKLFVEEESLSYPIEEFVRLYAQKELLKVKTGQDYTQEGPDPSQQFASYNENQSLEEAECEHEKANDANNYAQSIERQNLDQRQQDNQAEYANSMQESPSCNKSGFARNSSSRKRHREDEESNQQNLDFIQTNDSAQNERSPVKNGCSEESPNKISVI